MNNQLLPIGSVVLLKGGTKELMINGYLPVDKNTGEIYEYSACLFPEGLLLVDEIALIKADAIEKVLFKGYTTAASENVLKKLTRINNMVKENPNISKEQIETLMTESE